MRITLITVYQSKRYVHFPQELRLPHKKLVFSPPLPSFRYHYRVPLISVDLIIVIIICHPKSK